MMLLRQSTAVDIPMGPFLDETDGTTAETALTITQPDIRLKKNGGNWAQKNAAQTLSHEENGWYEASLDATDTNTLGHLVVAVHESGALPVWREFMVVPANVYDSLVAGSDQLEVDATRVAGASQSAGDLASLLNSIDDFLDTEVAAILAAVDTEVAAIKARTDNLPASPAAVGSAMTLTSSEREAIAAALLDLAAGVETGRTLRQALRLILASAAGKLSGAATTTIAIRDTNDAKDRITATVDASGNRTAVTLDAS